MFGAVCLLASQLVSTFSSRVKDIYTLQRLKGTAQPPPCDSKKSNYLQPQELHAVLQRKTSFTNNPKVP